MKHLKLYENQNEPKVGDWVFAFDIDISNDVDNWKDMNEFMRTHLGEVKEILSRKKLYVIQYFNIPSNILKLFLNAELNSFVNTELNSNSTNSTNSTTNFNLLRDEITYWSEDKEWLQNKMNLILASEKYNL